MTLEPWRLLARTIAHALGRRPDVSRWEHASSFEAEWDERSRIIAGLVPAGSRVIEFGAGRQQLARDLDPTCMYLASDVIRRDASTLVADLNARPLPDLSALRPDVAVFAGVLEYLVRLAPITRWLARHVATCIASYECGRTPPWSPARLGERLQRARLGWVSTYTEAELLALFRAAGFACEEKTVWHTPTGDEPIFVFRRRPG
jgi:hypothetical protein